MNLVQLRCFVVVAEELHFGKAAQRLDLLPAALGRHIKLLEDSLGTRLFDRTTRSVSLTHAGNILLKDAQGLVLQTESLAGKIRALGRKQSDTLRIGTIDSAAAGLLPTLLQDFRAQQPNIRVQLFEEKTVALLPRLLSGRLDLAFVRPPPSPNRRIEFSLLLHETSVIALPSRHRLASRRKVSIADLADESFIVPERRSRPHSYDLTMKLFREAGFHPRVVQIADEKQTIVNLVAAHFGVAIVPRWTSHMSTSGVRFVDLAVRSGTSMKTLPLAAAWLKGSRDEIREDLLRLITRNLKKYGRSA